ncbi:histone acetyltransferase p300 [Trichonephila clavipes]|nr:histone acetyltransferase p300 [Trichonephila clavipes]
MHRSNYLVVQSASEQSTSSDHQNAATYIGGGVNAAPSSATADVATVVPPSLTADREKIKLKQLQIVLLMHAHSCPSNENQSGGDLKQCSLANCSSIKRLLNHMNTCQDEETCPVPHCVSSRRIVTHCKNCAQNDCPICVPIKQAARGRMAVQVTDLDRIPAPADRRIVYVTEPQFNTW